MLKKKDLKCIGKFIADKYPKPELNFALVGNGGIFATDTRKAIKFHFSDVQCCDLLVHKKLLKGFESTMAKDSVAKITATGSEAYISSEMVEMDLSTADFEYKYPESDLILDKELPHHFKLTDLDDILFELSEKFCFIDSSHLYPLIEHDGGDWYDVFYSPMTENDMGAVKIVASHYVDEEEVIFYTAVIMGRQFKSQAQE